MNILQAIILGLVQGLTEFIPVSSSGHLVLLHQAMGITENGLAFDVALHFGTLMALLIYFYKDIVLLIKGILGKNEYTQLAWLIVLATVPAALAGVALESTAESAFRSAHLVAINLIVAACLMLLAEHVARRYTRKTQLKKITWSQALTIGVAQAVALVPGISRSGSTITTGLFLGIDRVAATRFAFLLGIPITTGAILKVMASGDTLSTIQSEAGVFAVGIVTALISGLLAIRFLLKFLAKHTLAVFAYYRIALGLLVIILAL
jgi:undecaprenyl-diphosphatase